MKREEIRIRDPYIVLEGDTYYMYATSGETTMSYYTSTDLENWELGGVAFQIPEEESFWAYKDVWASEVHKYQGKFYLFVSLLGKDGLRGTQIAVADQPCGPFIPLENRPVTPRTKSCIDGTLFVCNGTPYVIYSRDWPDHYVAEKDVYIGQIFMAELSKDLRDIVGEPVVLFESDEVPLSKAAPNPLTFRGKRVLRYGSDAPFVQTLSDGRLLLTWSPYLKDHYVVLGAISKSGDIHGPWTHLDTPIFEEDGGHAMFFTDKQGRRCMCLHAPERAMLERACIFEMQEQDGTLTIVKEIKA